MDPLLVRNGTAAALEPADRAFVESLKILRRVDRSEAAFRRQMQFTRHTIIGSLRELHKHKAGRAARIESAPEAE